MREPWTEEAPGTKPDVKPISKFRALCLVYNCVEELVRQAGGGPAPAAILIAAATFYMLPEGDGLTASSVRNAYEVALQEWIRRHPPSTT